MFVNGEPFLITVTMPLGLILVSDLKGRRTAAAVRDALWTQLARYAAEGFRITTLLVDGEGAIVPITPLIERRGIRVNTTAAGQHVHHVERRIRVVKERCRGIINTLPFQLSTSLIKWLVFYVVSRLNLMPSSTSVSRISPREAFTGRKTDYNRDCRVIFGQYCQVDVPDGPSKNSMKTRTEGAIALLPTGNLQGSVKFLSLATGMVVSRESWTALPMPLDVVNRLNEMSNGISLTEDSITYGTRRLIVAADEHQPPAAPVFPREETHDGTHTQVSDDSCIIENELPPTTDSREHLLSNETAPAPDIVIGDGENPGSVDMEDKIEEISADASNSEAPEPTEQRYNLRPRPDRSHAAQHVRDRLDCCSLHITATKGLRKFGKDALGAMVDELQQMLDKNVFHPVSTRAMSDEQRKSVICSSIFLKEKYRSDGTFDKLKGRLVAGGHMQDRSMFEDNSSPTVATTSTFMLAALAARENRHVVTADIGGAYLNASMGEHMTFMRLDPLLSSIIIKLDPSYENFIDARGEVTVQLDKALYGCVQSAKLWYEHLRTSLERIGFVTNPNDICVFNKGDRDEQCTICVHVDDLMITCKNAQTINDTIEKLIAEYEEVKVSRGTKHSYLGMTFDFSTLGKASITMEGYITYLLRHYDVTKRATTPATANLFAIAEDSPLLSSDDKMEFHSATAKLLYLAKRVRPEILTACSFLASRVTCATEEDLAKLQRVLAYLNAEPNLGLVLEAHQMLEVNAFVDASYGVHLDGKSHTGGVISVGKGAVYVKSTKQRLVSKSSTEAELITLSDMTSNVIWTRDFLLHQGYSIKAANVYQDNTSTIALAERGRSTSERTKHVHIRYFFVKDRIESGEIKITYLPTNEMVADILTKPLQGELFRTLRDRLLNCSHNIIDNI